MVPNPDRVCPMRAGSGHLALALAVCAAALCTSCDSPASWRVVHQRLPGALLSVWGTSARDIFCVGGDSQNGRGPLVLRFDGTTWRRLDSGLARGDLWWVYGVAAESVFMVGSGGVVLRFNPSHSTFERMLTPSGLPTIYGIWGGSDHDVWAVGGLSPDRVGVLWHFDGAVWSDRTSTAPAVAVARGSFFKVWGRTAADVWVVGDGGTAIHWDGSMWSDTPTNTSHRLLTVHGDSARTFAVGGVGTALVLEGSGTQWQIADVPPLPGLNGVFVPATGDPVAVGISGLTARRTAAGWVEDSMGPATSLDFHAVWADPGGGIWAVGGQVASAPLTDGMLWHFGGSSPGGTIENL